MRKERVFSLLVSQRRALDKDDATALVMSGRVFAGSERIRSASELLDEKTVLSVTPAPPFVSRAGLKLAFALDRFGVDVSDMVVLDVGASTGGFTHCLLQRGARTVYALDVGTNQLAYSLRIDPRVVVMEQTNVRTLQAGMLKERPDLAVCDVSFMSVRHVFAAVAGIVGELVALVKPQFEASRDQMRGSGGKCDPALHEGIIAGITEYARSLGYVRKGLAESPIAGRAKGNVEYVTHWVREGG